MKRFARVVLFFIIPTLIALIIIALYAFPFVAKNYINEHGKEYAGRKLAVNQIHINYWNTTLRVIDFKMFESDDVQPFVTFDTLLIKINPFRLLSSELNVGQFRLVKPEMTVTRRDTTFNFDDIIAFFKAKPKVEPTKKSSKPFKYVIRNISLDRGTFTFNDKGANYSNIMKDLGFTIPYVSYNEDEISKVGLKFHFENGGFFQATANYNLKMGVYRADFAVNQLDISPFLPYTKDYLKLKSLEGLISGDFHLNGNISKLDSIMISGDGNVADFAAKDLAGTKVLGAKKGHVVMQQSYPMKFAFNFDTIALTEPYLFFEMKDSTNNFLNLMVDQAPSGEPMKYYYQIKHFKIGDGIVDFRDKTHAEPFNYHIDQISLKVDSITSVSQWIDAYSSARLNNHGKLKVELGINPANPFELKINYVLTNFVLTDLNIYSLYYVGFPVILGNMYYQGKTVIKARQISSENKLIIRNAKLGKKSGGLMNIPLKLALYLLKDVHGDVTLDLPLTGDLNDPKTKIGKLIWQVFKNVITKVVASPFRALSGLLGVNPDEIKGIEFDYADTTITDRHLRRIKLFTELEKKKPDMKVELAYFNDVGLEKQQIAVNEAGKIFNKETGADFKKERTKFLAFIAKKLNSDTASVVPGAVRMIGTHKLDSIQDIIALKRIKEINELFHKADSTSKIKVFIPDKEAPENVGSRPVFELKCSVDE